MIEKRFSIVRGIQKGMNHRETTGGKIDAARWDADAYRERANLRAQRPIEMRDRTLPTNEWFDSVDLDLANVGRVVQGSLAIWSPFISNPSLLGWDWGSPRMKLLRISKCASFGDLAYKLGISSAEVFKRIDAGRTPKSFAEWAPKLGISRAELLSIFSKTESSAADPLDDLLHGAPGGPWSDAAIERAGGPSHNTLNRARKLGEMRRDAVSQLARVLGCSPSAVSMALTAQAERAKVR